jgi:hypothetical protein
MLELQEPGRQTRRIIRHLTINEIIQRLKPKLKFHPVSQNHATTTVVTRGGSQACSLPLPFLVPRSVDTYSRSSDCSALITSAQAHPQPVAHPQPTPFQHLMWAICPQSIQLRDSPCITNFNFPKTGNKHNVPLTGRRQTEHLNNAARALQEGHGSPLDAMIPPQVEQVWTKPNR